MGERARAVETLLADVNSACEKIVRDVFGDTKKEGEQQQQDESNGSAGEAWKATGGDAVFQEFAAGGGRQGC